jgi:hypothetical protein
MLNLQLGILANAVTLRREFTTLFNRVAIFILLYSGIMCYDSLFVTYLDTGIGAFNGLFHSTATSHSFDLFIYIIAPTILLLTAFYARRIVEPIIAYNRFVTGRPTKNGDGVYSKGNVKAYMTMVIIIFILLSFIFDDQGSVLSPILTLGVMPVVSYSNTDTQKIQILHENKHKSGIYR